MQCGTKQKIQENDTQITNSVAIIHLYTISGIFRNRFVDRSMENQIKAFNID